MDERVLQFRVGVVVVASVIITSILVIFFQGKPDIWKKKNTVFLHFDSAPGIQVDSPVRKHGILIGRVESVKLEKDGVLVCADLDAKYPVTRGEVCRLTAGSLFGDRVLEFVPGRQESEELIKDGDYIDQTEVSSDAFQVLVNLEQRMTEAIDRIGVAGDKIGAAGVQIISAGEKVSDLATNINEIVVGNKDQFERTLARTEKAMESFELAMAAVHGVAGDEEFQARLQKALQELPEMLQEAHQMVLAMKKMADHADVNLAQLEGLTKPLGERGGQLVANIEQGTKSLEELLTQLATLSKRLENPEGTVGQLINNPDLYQKLDAAASNIEEITRRMRPIMDDARVIAAKIAHDPGRIGVKGVLDRNQSGSKHLGTDFGLTSGPPAVIYYEDIQP
jgi:phospholipid/cholesterol/gamma-HCH transport system substrate-binding protein